MSDIRRWLEEPITAPRWVVLACVVTSLELGAVMGWAAHILWRMP